MDTDIDDKVDREVTRVTVLVRSALIHKFGGSGINLCEITRLFGSPNRCLVLFPATKSIVQEEVETNLTILAAAEKYRCTVHAEAASYAENPVEVMVVIRTTSEW